MGKNQQFQKFINQKSNAAKKEQFKQEKRKAKKDRAAAIEKRFEEKRQQRSTVSRAVPERKAAPETARPAAVVPGRPAAAGPKGPAKAAAQIPLNKYVAHSGICSRRDAADLIRKGEVRVNNEVVTEPGTRVSESDNITYKGKKINPSRNLVYILLNKPKDYITTLDDPEGRKTVLELIKQATNERVFPVGRLDRNTSGVLLITNDGELAQTLSHPSNQIKKIYEVRLDKPFSKGDFDKMAQGFDLEDGFIVPDSLGYADPKDKSIIGIEIHSGRNRIVRRMFEFLGYDVRGLDRVTYAGLTKKNVQRGKWRLLSEKEIRILRHFNPQTKKSKAAPAAKPGSKHSIPAPVATAVAQHSIPGAAAKPPFEKRSMPRADARPGAKRSIPREAARPAAKRSTPGAAVHPIAKRSMPGAAVKPVAKYPQRKK